LGISAIAPLGCAASVKLFTGGCNAALVYHRIPKSCDRVVFPIVTCTSNYIFANIMFYF
jgi:hypothetical protein